ncbi:hypothetical protein [Deinococcus cellulosilyticus]|uniref:Uncharacterized protein n=1 Tax=Deinococcus cellulosilyticus (strain DSM 18568 / NBRC 106333 / KACC 11606 / 5516J-15) TaxID=1223518 RepID=A0A511N7E3_DEIC1|nr:hypothetical protein [Deinococcus cellulosilyticus]GEM48754.1 hypothetical protein DC3_43890 [Deinococcus cellulosilyticus NBRC 106333 = KACC 11606]
MSLWRKTKAAYFRFRRTLQVWLQVYRQVVSIWRMFKSARQPTAPQSASRQHTRATIKSGRTVDVDVIPPQR